MRTIRLLATAAVALGMSANLTAAQGEEPPVEATPCQFSTAQVTPSSVVLGISKVKTVNVTATATGCDGYSWGWLEFGSDNFGGELDPSADDPTQWLGTIVLDPHSLYNSDAGTAVGLVHLDGADETTDLGASLTLKRAVMLADVGVSTKRPRKGKAFWVGANISRADWDRGFYNRYSNKLVRLQFRPTHGHYKTIKKVRSVRLEFEGSVVETKARTRKSGCYRWVSDATATTTSATSKSVCLKVR